MKGRQFQKFAAKFLIPQMPGFTVQHHLIYQVPVGNVFRGFVFESSGFSAETFHPTVCVQPLYVPSDYITMTLAQRLLGVWKFYSGGDPVLAEKLLQTMRKEGLRVLEDLGTPEKIAHRADRLEGGLKNPYVRQDIAYSLALIGEDQEALERLDQLLVMLKEMMSGVQKWAANVHAEVLSFRETLAREPEQARHLLAKWTEETRRKLRLPA